jgi:cytochrome c peroxidase
MVIPADNRVTSGKIALGKRLFADKRLSGDRSVACASCHQAQYGFTQGPELHAGAYGVKMNRACPSLINVGHQREFFWEGSVPQLESAVRGVWQFILVAPAEGRPTIDDVTKRVNADAQYRHAFRREFGSEATPVLISRALATYLRTLDSNDLKWTRFYRGDTKALPIAARRGYAIFNGKAACSACHSGLMLTDLQYHNVGIGSKGREPASGRFAITQQPRDRGAFKTPTLLYIARTAPYFHDHSVATLEEAVDQMLNGGIDNPNLDRTHLQAVRLTATERSDLLAFLRALSR